MKNLFKIIAIIIVIILLIASAYFLFFKKQGKNQDNSWIEIKKKGKIVVGTEIPYSPMEFYDEKGELTGFDIEMMKEIAKRLKIGIEFKKYEWDFLLDAAKNNEVNLVASGVTISQERSKEMLFSIPYLDSGQVLIVKTENKEIFSLIDLKGKKIGVEGMESAGHEIKQFIEQKNILINKDINELITALKTNKVDALVMDYIVAADAVRQDKTMKIVDYPFTQEFFGIVTSLQNNALMKKINEILSDLKKEGFLKNLEKKWLR